jgi:hypothetical protein
VRLQGARQSGSYALVRGIGAFTRGPVPRRRRNHKRGTTKPSAPALADARRHRPGSRLRGTPARSTQRELATALEAVLECNRWRVVSAPSPIEDRLTVLMIRPRQVTGLSFSFGSRLGAKAASAYTAAALALSRGGRECWVVGGLCPPRKAAFLQRRFSCPSPRSVPMPGRSL